MLVAAIEESPLPLNGPQVHLRTVEQIETSRTSLPLLGLYVDAD